MPTLQHPRGATLRALAAVLLGAPSLAAAQDRVSSPAAANPAAAALRDASRLDTEGATSQARVRFQQLIDSAPDPAAKAAAQRAMAMSYAFDGDCVNTVRYEQMAIAYWATREAADPQNAFYQEGELANEAARVCIDAGNLDVAERWYRAGYALGLKEPAPKTHAKSLWDFRLAHALARLAARRGQQAEAQRQVAAARAILAGDSAMAAQQARFFPSLVGYVALSTDSLQTAESELTRAIAMPGNARDPFLHCLLAMTEEKLGRAERAKAHYQQAYDLATAHNPPSAFARPYARRKLGLT